MYILTGEFILQQDCLPTAGCPNQHHRPRVCHEEVKKIAVAHRLSSVYQHRLYDEGERERGLAGGDCETEANCHTCRGASESNANLGTFSDQESHLCEVGSRK